jgi:opacity protein-like surface antigen
MPELVLKSIRCRNVRANRLALRKFWAISQISARKPTQFWREAQLDADRITLRSQREGDNHEKTRRMYCRAWPFSVTGGLAVTNENIHFVRPRRVHLRHGRRQQSAMSSPTNLHVGLAAGGGLEYGITQNLSAKGEWIWVGAGALNTLKENMLPVELNYALVCK